MRKAAVAGIGIALSAAFAAFAGDAKIESFTVETSSKANARLEVSCRIPFGFAGKDGGAYRIMVLFGGRNWDSGKAIRAYKFDDLADRRKLFLLSPGFRDDDYWEPERWSGKALLDAVAGLRKRYGIPEGKLLYYGYSAGGQCANLFAAWRPDLVEAWGCHACGVWSDPRRFKPAVPALVTCGDADEGRVQTSVSFVQSYRECGGPAVFKLYDGGHELPDGAVKLAEAFFDSILACPERKPLFAGDDQRMKYFTISSKEAKSMEVELRNEFYDEAVAKLWAEGR